MDNRIDLSKLSLEEKRELLAQLISDKKRATKGPLSFGQERIWIQQQLLPEASSHVVIGALRVVSRNPVSSRVVKQVLERIVERHEILRTTIGFDGVNPWQEVHQQVDLQLPELDLRNLTSREKEREMAESIRKDLQTPFDLSQLPLFRMKLFRLDDNDQIITLGAHHIIFDGPSIEIVAAELLQILSRPGAATLPPLRVQYRDFARRQREQSSQVQHQAELDYWMKKLEGIPALQLPTDWPRPAVRSFRGDLHRFQIPESLHLRLEELSHRQGVTPFAILLAGFKTLLHLYSGQNDFAVRTEINQRDSPEYEPLIGFLTNTLVIRSSVSGDEPFLEILREIQRTYLEALQHKTVPFELLLQKIGNTLDPSLAPLAQVGIVHLSRRRSTFSTEEGAMELLELASGISLLDLTLYIGTGEVTQSAIEFNTALFRRSSIESLAQNFLNLLEGVLYDPGQPISRISLITPEEQARIEKQLAGSRTVSAKPAVQRLFEEQAAARAEAPAVESRSGSLSYSQLNRRANRLAHLLQSRGVGPDVPVALLLSRSIELVVAQLAVLKAGGTYFCVDPGYPAERVRWMLEDVEPKCVVMAGSEADTDWKFQPCLLALDGLKDELRNQSAENLDWSGSPESLAYLIHTSGSTGRPKAVRVPHRALSNQMIWMQREFSFNHEDRILQRTPTGFDACLWEFFAPLISGSPVMIAPEEAGLDMTVLIRTIQQFGITHLQLVPSLLRILLTQGGLGDCPTLRWVFSGGERLTAGLQRAFFDQSTAQLVNLYGPAEACVNASFHRCRPDQVSWDAPLGRPVDNLQFWVLSSVLKVLPTGFPGELCISGAGLAHDYWNRPRETAAAFVEHPFRPGERLYRTGDRVRLDPEGTLHFLGRIDQQVKVAGVRIEPGEVEAALESHAEIERSVVTVRSAKSGEMQLVAYYTSAEPLSGGELRKFLQLKLPRFMIPSRFQHLQEIPLGPSGKVDPSSLPEIGPQEDASAPPRVVEPRNQTEEILQSIWREILELEEIGIHDNFFDLGAGSLQVIRMTSRAQTEGCPVNPANVFAYPTIAELAELIADGKATAAPALPELALEDLASLPELLPLRYLHPERQPQTRAGIVIESLGVYLPQREVSTESVIKSCRRPPRLALQKLTGIESRRMAGEDEFSIDLARHAVLTCLEKSRWTAGDIDVLICCSISRYDAPRSVTFEPSTAIRLKQQIGLQHALTFDLTNACAGFFTGIHVGDQLLRAGLVERVLIASGEYITHLTDTAQKEISEFLDPRLACLTLGDAGAAVILEKSENGKAGFHALDLLTLSRYCELCVAKATDQPHGGAIMHTDMVEVSATATRHSMIHAALVLNETGWTLEDFDHLLAHQTSRSALRGATREISRILGKEKAGEVDMIDNLSHRGNTASTSHMVALWDAVAAGTVQDNSSLFFSVSGSGQTIGSAIYRLDNLPSRIRGDRKPSRPNVPPRSGPGRLLRLPESGRLRIESLGVPDGSDAFQRDAIQLAQQAAEACLKASQHPRQEIDTLVHCGVYRNDFMAEPALATFLANRLGINPEVKVPDLRTTLAFDIFNGPVGVLNALAVAAAKTLLDPRHLTMITASEIENNAGCSEPLLGLRETGSALLVDRSEDGRIGFGSFLFRDFTQHVADFSSCATYQEGRSFLRFTRSEDFFPHAVEAIRATVEQLLGASELTPCDVSVVMAPLMGQSFLADLSRTLRIPPTKFAGAPGEDADLASSSIAYGFHALEALPTEDRRIALVIALSPGIQVGCAFYHF